MGEALPRGKNPQIGFVILLVVAVYLLFPFPQTIAPEWTVTTLDAEWRPLANITVREVWQQYSIEEESHEEDRVTDAHGRVQLPRRVQGISVARRWIGCLSQLARHGVHASCGANSYLVVFGNGVDTMDWANPEEEEGLPGLWQRSTLVLKRK